MSEFDSDPVTVAVQQIRPVEPGTLLENIEGQLSVVQLNVLEALMAGRSIKDAATVAQVGRTTVFRWIKSDPFFKAAYDAWKQEHRESAGGSISNMIGDAVTNVAKALSTGDARMSYQLLKDLGLLHRQKEPATDPALVRQQIAVDLHEQSPLSDPQALTNLLTQAGLSRAQQRRLLIQALRPLRPEDSRSA